MVPAFAAPATVKIVLSFHLLSIFFPEMLTYSLWTSLGLGGSPGSGAEPGQEHTVERTLQGASPSLGEAPFDFLQEVCSLQGLWDFPESQSFGVSRDH